MDLGRWIDITHGGGVYLKQRDYISGTNRDAEITLITDGRFSGASRGAIVGHISPETALIPLNFFATM